MLAQDTGEATSAPDSATTRPNPELDFTGENFIRGNVLPDTLPNDSLAVVPTDTVSATGKKRTSDITTTINYNAQDSMIFDLENQRLYMFGETHVDYGAISLEADQTTVDWVQRTIKSQYTLDSLGRKRGKPVFNDGGDVYETDDILYNFKSKRALIKGVVTEQDGAFMHGEDVKKNEDDEMFIRGAKYSTCNLGDPHFFIESKMLKAIPGNKVVSGPFNLKFREVPTPLWFPFGMFPQPRKKASGIVFPTYGEETRRGFFLRDGGYYLGLNDHMDLRVTGDIYSRGSHAININTNYKWRYKFNGGLNFSYLRNNIVQQDGSAIDSRDYWLRWNLRPETRGSTSLSASVSLGTGSYNNNNNLATQDYSRSINSQYSSSVSFSKKFNRIPFNMSSNIRQNQNVSTGIYSWTLPDFTMNMNRIYPLEKVVKNSKNPLAKISFSHNFVAKNEFSNAPGPRLPFVVANDVGNNTDTLEFDFNNLKPVYDRAKIGGRHSIPLSTSFNAFKYFTVSPSFNYNEVWFARELNFQDYSSEAGGVVVDTLEQFSRASSWTSGASVNTRLYGMYYTKGLLGIEAIRHVMAPSISFSYNPDFGTEDRGVFKTIVTDSLGTRRRVSRYEGFAYPGPSGSESRSLGFSLTNNLEMKVRTKNDTASEFKKIKVFDNLSFNTGYNFAADSFKLSNISWSTRTSFFQQKLSVNLNGAYDPYLYVDNGTATGRRVDRYAWNNGGGLGQMTSFSTAVTFQLRPKSTKSNTNTGDTSTPPPGGSPFDDPSLVEGSQYGTPEEKAYILQNPEEYVDFNIPWSMNISYQISQRKVGLDDRSISNHSFTLRGDLSITPKTKVDFNTAYDIRNKSFAMTTINVNRDLHCWTLAFTWVPFGRLQSFGLTIRPKSGLLQDLKLERRRSFQDFL